MLEEWIESEQIGSTSGFLILGTNSNQFRRVHDQFRRVHKNFILELNYNLIFVSYVKVSETPAAPGGTAIPGPR